MSPETIFCSRCGQSMQADATFCQRCGASMAPTATAEATSPPTVSPGQVPFVGTFAQPYGGFWIRVLAYIVDRIVVGITFTPVLIFFGLRLATQLHGIAPNDPEQLGPIFHFVGNVGPIALIVQWLYEALLTSSAWQGTVGKHMLDLKVTDEQGNRISFERATGRYFAKIISGLTLGIGYLMVAFTERKQGLHDMIAGTLVMKGIGSQQ